MRISRRMMSLTTWLGAERNLEGLCKRCPKVMRTPSLVTLALREKSLNVASPMTWGHRSVTSLAGPGASAILSKASERGVFGVFPCLLDLHWPRICHQQQ